MHSILSGQHTAAQGWFRQKRSWEALVEEVQILQRRWKKWRILFPALQSQQILPISVIQAKPRGKVILYSPCNLGEWLSFFMDITALSPICASLTHSSIKVVFSSIGILEQSKFVFSCCKFNWRNRWSSNEAVSFYLILLMHHGLWSIIYLSVNYCWWK